MVQLVLKAQPELTEQMVLMVRKVLLVQRVHKVLPVLMV
jgi:hypothetical protein